MSNNKLEDIIEDDTEETNYGEDSIEFWEDIQKEVITQPIDYNLKSLVDLIKSETINLDPFYQRRFRWDISRQSKLIESFLMNVPIPPIFLNEDDYGTYSIIDGKQRLHAIYSYLTNVFSLEGLEVFQALNGKHFEELDSRLQNILNTRSNLRAIIILRQSDPTTQFEVFKRLNTGGVHLNDQEIRNCALNGNFNELLIRLSENEVFAKLIGTYDNSSSPMYQQMKDVEWVLRFFTFRKNPEYYSGKISRRMDEYMSRYKKITKVELKIFQTEFLDTITTVKNIFGDKAFKRWKPENETFPNRLLVALYEVQMLICYKYLEFKDKLISFKDDIMIEFKELFSDDIFQDSISKFIHDENRFKKRMNFLDKIFKKYI